jgi:hypothetical protein
MDAMSTERYLGPGAFLPDMRDATIVYGDEEMRILGTAATKVMQGNNAIAIFC